MKKGFLIRCVGLGIIIIVSFALILAFKKPKEVSFKETPDQEETLALAQEIDEDGVSEKEQVIIIDEDEIQDVQQQEFDVANHSFVLDIATDDLAVSAPIFDGIGDGSLSRGIGRHVSTAIPNEESGNVVLSGHQWYPGDAPGYRVFENLDALARDDEISIRYGDKKYTYKVSKVKVVEPSDVSILEQTDKPQLTLYTCYPRFSTEKRLVYIADLINVEG